MGRGKREIDRWIYIYIYIYTHTHTHRFNKVFNNILILKRIFPPFPHDNAPKLLNQ